MRGKEGKELNVGKTFFTSAPQTTTTTTATEKKFKVEKKNRKKVTRAGLVRVWEDERTKRNKKNEMTGSSINSTLSVIFIPSNSFC